MKIFIKRIIETMSYTSEDENNKVWTDLYDER